MRIVLAAVEFLQHRRQLQNESGHSSPLLGCPASDARITAMRQAADPRYSPSAPVLWRHSAPGSFEAWRCTQLHCRKLPGPRLRRQHRTACLAPTERGLGEEVAGLGVAGYYTAQKHALHVGYILGWKSRREPSSQIDTVLLVYDEEGRLRNRGPLDVRLKGVRLN